ncbi:hypothetical protein O1611_g3773 [Lasiodiplodia mahajangana]|uniref:Uncharacterized protein n=1 Tax=Lasiodiplodia mahajangana TaxID=1108764 RepID=A0ACC2JR92_9PEZI|nr:hypothetical protein O1611_g3773 [Lasiodiplodia mahajangana]
MSSVRALLLLPLPPQRTVYSHIRTALYPSIRSTISSVSKPGRTDETSVLEIAVPITRLTEEAHTHKDLFVRVNPLVANLYRLIATICAELNIPHTGPGSVDVRVLFVQDEVDSKDGESDEKSSPFAVLNYAALAVSNRQWTHVFAVESEQGEQTFKKFWAIAREHGPNRGSLFTRVQRVVSGMQIYISDLSPAVDSDAVLETALAGRPMSREVAVEINGVVADQFTDKYLLTMALFAIPQLVPESEVPTGEGARGAGRITAIVSKEASDDDLKKRISDFLVTAVGKICSSLASGEQEDDVLQVRFSTRDEMDYTTGRLVNILVVSDGDGNLVNGWGEERARRGREIVLRSIRPVDKDINE